MTCRARGLALLVLWNFSGLDKNLIKEDKIMLFKNEENYCWSPVNDVDAPVNW